MSLGRKNPVCFHEWLMGVGSADPYLIIKTLSLGGGGGLRGLIVELFCAIRIQILS